MRGSQKKENFLGTGTGGAAVLVLGGKMLSLWNRLTRRGGIQKGGVKGGEPWKFVREGLGVLKSFQERKNVLKKQTKSGFQLRHPIGTRKLSKKKASERKNYNGQLSRKQGN